MFKSKVLNHIINNAYHLQLVSGSQNNMYIVTNSKWYSFILVLQWQHRKSTRNACLM
jgi:hypothetical protein